MHLDRQINLLPEDCNNKYFKLYYRLGVYE